VRGKCQHERRGVVKIKKRQNTHMGVAKRIGHRISTQRQKHRGYGFIAILITSQTPRGGGGGERAHVLFFVVVVFALLPSEPK